MKRINVLILLSILAAGAFAQPKTDYQVLDEVIAVVGNEIMLLSDFEVQKAQYREGGYPMGPDVDCRVLEAMLFEKLLLHQARVDSIEVSEDRIQSELNRRIGVFSQQLGGEEKLVEFYGKSLAEIKSEFHDAIQDQLMVQGMQQQITSDIRITPADVEDFYASIPEDSIPFIESEVEMSQIMIKPKPTPESIRAVKNRLEEYRLEVLAGTREFSTIALLYSEDTQTATRGGDIGMVGRGQLVSEFEQIAYNLKDGETSTVFETEFGFHVMQMIELRGDVFNARHILLKPKVTETDRNEAREKLLEIKNLILTDSLSFAAAAVTYSDDEGTKNNNGIIINPSTGSIRFPMAELDPQLFLIIDKLQVGTISEPAIMQSMTGDQAYRIVRLRERTEAHRANVIEDYQMLQEMTRSRLTDDALNDWLVEYVAKTFVRIDEDSQTCDFDQDWIKKR